MRVPAAHLLPFTFLFFLPLVRAAVLAIDYGAEFTKLSLVKPGVPFDVVLDRDSKRKVQSVVGWKREDRVFGAEGKMASTRFPDTHYPYIKPLLGKSELVTLDVYPNPPVELDGIVYFPHPSPPAHIAPAPKDVSQVWTPTALLAQQLAYFRGLAEDLSKSSGAEAITQVIVTVPAWWDQAQRRAYRDALELQGLTCLAMISDGTAVALNYAMTRNFPTFNPETGAGQKEYHIIYDSGAMQTTGSVVALYQTSVLPTPKSKTPVNTTHVELLGTGWEEVGGVMLDLTIREILAADFEAKSGMKGVRGEKRAMAKLGREAVRVKHILSANQESNVAIESLYEDVDYRSRLSRTDLEAASAPSLPLFAAPIGSALAAANVSLDSITSLILFGGNTRVPFVQSAVRSVLGDKEDLIAQNVNSDEAAVLGAAYYGAGLSRQFKMKNLEVTERSVYGTSIDGEALFPKGSRLGERKSLILPAKEDQVLEFYQNEKPILSVQLLDVATALSNWTASSPVVNLTMRLDPRGHLSAANAVLVSNVTDAKEGGVAGALKGLFGKKDEGKDSKEGNETDVSGSARAKADKVVVRFREKALGWNHLSGEDKRTIYARMTSIAVFEHAKMAREEARNMLEGYLYRLSGLLNPEGDNKSLLEYSTPDEQSGLSKLLKETFEWLSDEAERADEKTLRAKRTSLEKLESPIIIRFQESQTRYKAIEAFQQAMFASRSFLVEARKNNTADLEAAASAPADKPVAPPKYTETELSDVEEMMKELEGWMDGLMTEQMKIEGNQTKDPVIFTKDLDEKGKRLQMTVLRLINKKPPRAPRRSASSSSSSSSSASSSTSTTSATSAAEPTPSSEGMEKAEERPFLPTPDEAEPVETGPPRHEEL